jgi:hypothetical protein
LAAVTSYTQFFSGTATVAGALVGLLFVALSVAPERLRGAHASVEHQAIASTAFTALVDALFVSLIGLEPGGGLDYGAVILGTLGLTSSCGLAVRLWRSRAGEELSHRWPYLLGFIILVYGVQVITGIVLRTASSQASASVTFVYILFAVGIARSWELLGLHGGGPLDLLVLGLGRREPLSHGSDLPPAPPESTPGAELSRPAGIGWPSCTGVSRSPRRPAPSGAIARARPAQ